VVDVPLRIDVDDADVGDGNHFWYQGELFTGELVETDRAGNVLAVKPVVKGRGHGIEREGYPDGTLRYEAPVVQGRPAGTSRHWHRNGRLAEEREFDDRNDLVACRRWDAEGNLVESKRYGDA
jgi:antitoxin component YwqK of YwqJK toxin-antitoxin module